MKTLALAAALVATALVPYAAFPSAAEAQPASITLNGHGFGHGRGMGQFGALGYAIGEGWSYHQILDHYYGGTTVGQAPANTIMTVDMTDRDGADTIVVQENGDLSVAGTGVACVQGSPCAVDISRSGPGQFVVSQGTTCTGGPAGWKVVDAAFKATSVPVVATAGATDTREDMLQLCESDGIRWLRGDIWAVDTGTTQATVNHLPLEAYVQGVVPRESPASWGTMGDGAGEQALMAQAVAARSYALADTFTPWAKTCDSTACQVYGGRAFQDNSGDFTDLEGTSTYATSDSAVQNTAGEVRIFTAGGGGPAGTIALTEYSSSTGGYTAGGVFPAVPDAGDATPSNPNHDWTATVTASQIESAFGTGLGAFESIDVTARNGLGDLGGRVTKMVIQFSGGPYSTTGAAFAGGVGLPSNWFTVSSGSGTPTTTAPPPAPLGYDVLTANGIVSSFGAATSYGSLLGSPTVVDMATRPGGYWILAASGAVHFFGSAVSYGSLSGLALNAPPFQIAATPTGNGYWIVAFDGGVFSFGDAAFHGSTGGMRLNKPIVGMGPTLDGGGYWLVASDGGIFSFGDALFHGSTGAMTLSQPIIAMAVTPDGGGYYLLDAVGGVFTFGDATFNGSLPGLHVSAMAAGIVATPGGYLVATNTGKVYGFGATASGGPASASPTVAIALAK